MSLGLPLAVINGIGRFGAKKLAELLVESDIQVIGVGDYRDGLTHLNNFELRGMVGEIETKVDYVFDFEGEAEAWEMAEKNEARLAIIGVNKPVIVTETIKDLKANWRVLNFHGVYGAGMMDEEVGEVAYLIEAVKLAVANKNLVLPSRESTLRLLSDKDLTEAVMRGTFLSGTEGETFEVWGKEVEVEDLARVLIDEAKMTRFKVVEGATYPIVLDRGEVEGVWQSLRWRPESELAESMKEVLQEAFSTKDEESRRKPNPSRPVAESPLDPPARAGRGDFKFEEKIKPEKRYEVEIEEVVEEKIKKEESRNIQEELKKIILEEYGDAELPEAEIEEIETEIKPILVKNSNARLVQTEVTEEIKVQPVPEDKKIEPIKTVRKKVDWMGWGWKCFAACWGIILIMLLVFLFKNYSIYRNIKQVKVLVNERKYDQAKTVVAKTLVTVKKEEEEIINWGLNQWVWGRRYQELLKVAEQGLLIGDRGINLVKQAEVINDGVFKDKDVDWKKEMVGMKLEMDSLSDDVGVILGRLAGDWRWLPSRWRGNLMDIRTQLTKVNGAINSGAVAVEALPEILGTDGKRREYMVLFQNESELRPGGGFIGSYGILSFEGGSLKNFEIKDVYEADGQLKGHVEPPEPIKNYLGEAQWYMRDANWQPDFGGNGRDIQWFLEKETGRKVDGVIGIDLAVAKGLLGVTGEIYVPDFKEKINSSNLYEQAEFYSETNSFPGSVQKASFLGGLGKQLFEEIKNLKSEKRLELLQTLVDLAEKNELQIWSSNKTVAGVMNRLGWSGEVYQGKCSLSADSGCFADYLYVLEANVGVNKANYFLYRNIDQTVDIGEQAISRVVKISYENTAKSNSWPGGSYKNYLRVYIPSTSNLAEVSVSEVGGGGVKTIYSGDSLKINSVQGKKEIGFLVTVPAGAKRIVEIRYLDQVNVGGKNKFTYVNYIQKQSGFGDTGMVNLVSIPERWQANLVEPLATMVNGKLLFNQKLDRDIKMGVEISR